MKAWIWAGSAPGLWDRNRPGHWVSRSVLFCLPGSVTHTQGAKWTLEKAMLSSLLGRKMEQWKAPMLVPSVPSPCLVFIGLVTTCCYVRDLLNICFLYKEHYSKTGLAIFLHSLRYLKASEQSLPQSRYLTKSLPPLPFPLPPPFHPPLLLPPPLCIFFKVGSRYVAMPVLELTF